MFTRSIRSRFILPRPACLFMAAISLLTAISGCDGDVSKSRAMGAAARDVRTSNIVTWADGRSGTNRWVGDSNNGAPVIDVVVPTPLDPAQERIAAAAHDAVAEVNRKMSGLLTLREMPTGTRPHSAHIELSYQTAYVPPATIDDSAYCTSTSDAPGQPGRFRPGPDGRRDHGTAWLNLGNGHCTVRKDDVVHQLAVALGLDAPFPGFDSHGPAVSASLWDALATLYANPVQTAAAALQLRQADPSPYGSTAQSDKGEALLRDSQLTTSFLTGP